MLRVVRFGEVGGVSEEKIQSIIRDFVGSFEKGDVEKTLSFLAEDVVWVAPEGTFRGKGEVRRLLAWAAQAGRVHHRDAGIGIMVRGNRAVYEYIIEGSPTRGAKYETPGVCVYEFSGEKIQHHRAFFDRLSVASQTVAESWFAKRVVGSIVGRYEKGLR